MDFDYHACIGERFEIQPINCPILNVKIITSGCLESAACFFFGLSVAELGTFNERVCPQ